VYAQEWHGTAPDALLHLHNSLLIVTGTTVSDEEVDRVIETGEAENLFQKAFNEQVVVTFIFSLLGFISHALLPWDWCLMHYDLGTGASCILMTLGHSMSFDVPY
jgi:hypothetical protein